MTFEVIACDEAVADTAAFCAHHGWPLERSANCILVSGRDEPRRYAACVLLATTKLDVNHVVRRRLEVKRASFATAEETVALTGMRIGGVTPFGLPPEVPLWIDPAVLAVDRVVIGAGTRSEAPSRAVGAAAGPRGGGGPRARPWLSTGPSPPYLRRRTGNVRRRTAGRAP